MVMTMTTTIAIDENDDDDHDTMMLLFLFWDNNGTRKYGPERLLSECTWSLVWSTLLWKFSCCIIHV